MSHAEMIAASTSRPSARSSWYRLYKWMEKSTPNPMRTAMKKLVNVLRVPTTTAAKPMVQMLLTKRGPKIIKTARQSLNAKPMRLNTSSRLTPAVQRRSCAMLSTSSTV